MDCEAEVLQHRVEVTPFEGRGIEPREGIRRDQCAEKGEDENPKEHRALVVPPNAGDLIDRRHRRVRILGDIQHRKIGDEMRLDQRAERQSDRDELADRRRLRDPDQALVATRRAP
jgi:hypothetical protein